MCSELEKGEKPFSQIVREAKKKDYTEPHPLEDLSGEDVKRKLIILLRSAGIGVKDGDIELTGMVDAKAYANLSPEEFMTAIQAEDARFATLVARGQEKGNVPRYVASYTAK